MPDRAPPDRRQPPRLRAQREPVVAPHRRGDGRPGRAGRADLLRLLQRPQSRQRADGRRPPDRNRDRGLDRPFGPRPRRRAPQAGGGPQPRFTPELALLRGAPGVRRPPGARPAAQVAGPGPGPPPRPAPPPPPPRARPRGPQLSSPPT